MNLWLSREIQAHRCQCSIHLHKCINALQHKNSKQSAHFNERLWLLDVWLQSLSFPQTCCSCLSCFPLMIAVCPKAVDDTDLAVPCGRLARTMQTSLLMKGRWSLHRLDAKATVGARLGGENIKMLSGRQHRQCKGLCFENNTPPPSPTNTTENIEGCWSADI